MKEKMSVEEPEQEEDPKGRERTEVGSKRKILKDSSPGNGKEWREI